jgi:hypothetical protein
MKSAAAFNVAKRRLENNVFGCPHHKQDRLATVVGLPQAEQTLTRRMEGIFRGNDHSQTRQRPKCSGKTRPSAQLVSSRGSRAFRAA